MRGFLRGPDGGAAIPEEVEEVAWRERRRVAQEVVPGEGAGEVPLERGAERRRADQPENAP